MSCFRSVILIIVILCISTISHATWQETLEANFDIVSTFDDLDDWGRSISGDNTVDIETYPNAFPKKTIDQTPSIWQYYSDYKGTIGDIWIKNHGAENIWRSTGKSASIDYGEGLDGIVYGPSRLGFKIGNSPEDGYEEVHVFFMSKWFKNFFKQDDEGEFIYHRFLKTLDISAGFKTVRHWGTVAEYNYIESSGGSGQVLNEYGMNAQVYNYKFSSDDGRIKNTYLTSSESNISYTSNAYYTEMMYLKDQVENNSWYGIEYRVKSSLPNGTANGEFEVWIYDADGNIVGHHLTTGVINIKDGNTSFNHKWNKFVWGGNRFAGSYCPAGDPLCDFGPVDNFYFDDVIVHGNRIGPTYFTLLAADQGDPLVTINSPTTESTYSTTEALITIGGTATDNGSISFVEWSNDRNGSGLAVGTTSWSVANIPLLVGENIITITATDNENNSSTDIITVLRTQALTDIDDYTSGVNLIDWSILWSTPGTSYNAIQVAAELYPVGTKQCAYIQTTTGINAITWDAIGNIANIDILAKIKSDYVDILNDGIRIYARASGVSGHENAYYVNFKADSFELLKYLNGISTNLASILADYRFSTTSFIRFNLNGSVLKVKLWAAGTVEPYEWLINITDTSLTSGAVGFGGYDINTDYEIDYFGVVTW